jgi:hypothetical protein
MNTLSNSVAFLVATVGWSLLVLTQVMTKGGRLRFKWEDNALEIYVSLDDRGGTQ